NGYFNGGRYSTPVGGIDNVALADGSRMTLNTDTRIRVALTETERRIELDKGEGFFEVAKDPSRPFVVYAGNKRVVAVGTKFSVRRENDDVEVIVTEGRVRLGQQSFLPSTAREGSSAASAGTGNDARNSRNADTLLNAGTVARTSKDQILVRPDAAAEAE